MNEPFDPILLAVLANRFDGIVREMTNTLLRTGRSAVLNTCRDFSCSVLTARNELVAAAEGLPIHIIGSQLLGEAMQRNHPDMKEGDAFLHNDPYDGNTHHADYSVLVPVFWGREHVFTAVAKAHQADCGNSRPTTYATYAHDIYEEGALNFPCVRIQQDYTDNDDLIRMCLRRIRVPEQWYGDYLATLGAARVGEAALKELLRRYGADVLSAFLTEWFRYSEERMIDALRAMPTATLTGHGRHDPVFGAPDGIPLSVRIDIRPQEAIVVFDLRDNLDCLPNGFNLSKSCSMASVLIGLFNQLPASIPHNEGSFRRVRVLLRENCVAGIPRHPASCSIATTNVAERLVHITQATLANLGDLFGLAEGPMGQGPGLGVISGVDARRSDSPYINQVMYGYYGGPAGPHEDGWLTYCTAVNGGLGYRDSVEITEQKYPLLVEEIRLLPDAEGAGRYRGAPAMRIAYGPTSTPMTVAYTFDGHVHPPRGVRGGADALPREAYVLTRDGERRDIDTKGEVVLQPGERIVDVASGGGGYGPPSERDPLRVLKDVRAALVSRERAERIYRVVVTRVADDFELDEEGTRILRSPETASVVT